MASIRQAATSLSGGRLTNQQTVPADEGLSRRTTPPLLHKRDIKVPSVNRFQVIAPTITVWQLLVFYHVETCSPSATD